jgi:hypothetical protein
MYRNLRSYCALFACIVPVGIMFGQQQGSSASTEKATQGTAVASEPAKVGQTQRKKAPHPRW